MNLFTTSIISFSSILFRKRVLACWCYLHLKAFTTMLFYIFILILQYHLFCTFTPSTFFNIETTFKHKNVQFDSEFISIIYNIHNIHNLRNIQHLVGIFALLKRMDWMFKVDTFSATSFSFIHSQRNSI